MGVFVGFFHLSVSLDLNCARLLFESFISVIYCLLHFLTGSLLPLVNFYYSVKHFLIASVDDMISPLLCLPPC